MLQDLTIFAPLWADLLPPPMYTCAAVVEIVIVLVMTLWAATLKPIKAVPNPKRLCLEACIALLALVAIATFNFLVNIAILMSFGHAQYGSGAPFW